MRIFLAGATGVLGQRLVPLLIADGHVVAGMTRTPEKARALRDQGAEPIVCDVFDAPALREAVASFEPDLVISQLTDLPDDAAEIPRLAGRNARIRSEGVPNLIAAAGGARTIAQSVAWELPPPGAEAVAAMEAAVLAADGVVLRYGQFHGPGTYHEAPPDPPFVSLDNAAAATVAALDAPSGVVVVVDPDGAAA